MKFSLQNTMIRNVKKNINFFIKKCKKNTFKG
jgi:hypothetical protein